VTLAGYFLLGRFGKPERAIAWLILASLFFYGWWNPVYLLLIFASILINFWVGRAIDHDRDPRRRKALLIAGISIDLAILVYFKYTNFLVDSFNRIAGTNIVMDRIFLPLAISFYTFQQIAYLVDAYRGETREYRMGHYCLFVCFFPQLIAGPIVHHKEMLSQFARSETFRASSRNFAVGLTFFAIGLFKKTVIADGIAPYSTTVFAAAEGTRDLLFYEAWLGGFAFAFQVYFDFSGYSDMAIGLARLFGIKLPLNFNSPYKATGIIEFWKRWHLTLSRFLRDYLYFPLGGNRHGKIKRYRNLMITMILGGIWHGAGWNYALWGGIHGIFLVINHAWRNFTARFRIFQFTGKTAHAGYVLLTFLAFTASIVVFKAATLDGAGRMLEAMFGFNGIPSLSAAASVMRVSLSGFGWCAVLAFICWALPNSQEIMNQYEPAVDYRPKPVSPMRRVFEWRPTLRWSMLLAFMFVVAIASMNQISEFLYFQF
jgi:D-alanyl-lipoteichoic acid acyltransferase DltB (MBOAT superfamily)